MAIKEFSPKVPQRAKIAFVGDMPDEPDLVRFTERKFLCERARAEQLGDTSYIKQLDAVVWTHDPRQLTKLPQQLEVFAPSLLNNDVRMYVRLAEDAQQTAAPRDLVIKALQRKKIPAANLRREEWAAFPEDVRERESSFLMPCVYLFESAASWPDIAAIVCDRIAGPTPDFDLKFDDSVLLAECGADGHEERKLLFRRAFAGSSKIDVVPIGPGLSGAHVFKVYASKGAGVVQSDDRNMMHPMLRFVKLGPRKKIIDEYDKYLWEMLDYVPFHLRPGLRLDLCHLGFSLGILVGDFVEGTESLISCARGGRCGHAVSNLFEKTLGGWRRQMRPDRTRTLAEYLAKKWCAEGSDDLIALSMPRQTLVESWGGDISISRLKRIFEKHAKSAVLYAPAHGDLHATNILVRHGDAIIIDFEKMEKHYPLTYDPASLEGGILVEGFVRDFKKGRFPPSDIVDRLKPLYEPGALKSGQSAFCDPGDPTEWYYHAINQLRTLSWSSELAPGQYALTLALCLIRKGCNSQGLDDPRAIAFYFGQKILNDIEVAGKPKKNRTTKAKNNAS